MSSLHWVLDVAFREDAFRIRKDDSSGKFALPDVLLSIYLRLKRQTNLVLPTSESKPHGTTFTLLLFLQLYSEKSDAIPRAEASSALRL